IDARSGKVRWRKYFRGMCSAASPAVARGVMYQPFVPMPCTKGDRSRAGLLVGDDLRRLGEGESVRDRVPQREAALARAVVLALPPWPRAVLRHADGRLRPRLRPQH